MTLELGVLADDLTGALASAARLRGRGLRTAVVWRDGELPEDVEALVVDMRTRDRGVSPGDEAFRWAARLRERNCRRLEQRIDSALQGRPADELAGVLRRGGDLVLAVPAFPGAGRTTVGGRQRVATSPPREIDVGERLFPGGEVTLVPLDVVERGPDAVAELVASGSRRAVADATSDEHLETLARAVATLEADGVDVVTASPGAWLRFHPVRAVVEAFVLVVVSSPTPENRAQLAVLREGGRGLAVVDTLDAPASPDLARRAAEQGRTVLEERRGCRGIVVSGGHTGSCLLDALGARSVSPVRELAPLCPLGLLVGGRWSGLPIATKGGLVGSERTLLELTEALWKES